MDGFSSWLFRGHGDVTDSENRYGSAAGTGMRDHEEKDAVISLQLQQQLKQICKMMDTEEHGSAEALPTLSSSTFGSFTGSTTAPTSCHQPADVSSLQIPLSPAVYADHNGGLFYSNLDDKILNLDELMTKESHQKQPRSENGHEFGGAFRPYVRHQSPRKKLNKPGACCGQKAIKDAMSALTRMHMARLAQWQSYQMAMAAPPSVGSNNNQIQHVLSERKRREKLNESFKALSTVLPPGHKKDRASTLLRARDYVNTLRSRVSELEEKNRMLIESQLHNDDGSEQDY